MVRMLLPIEQPIDSPTPVAPEHGLTDNGLVLPKQSFGGFVEMMPSAVPPVSGVGSPELEHARRVPVATYRRLHVERIADGLARDLGCPHAQPRVADHDATDCPRTEDDENGEPRPLKG